MLTHEEQAVIDRLRKTGMKIEADFKAGLISEKKYQDYLILLDEAAYKIKALSSRK